MCCEFYQQKKNRKQNSGHKWAKEHTYKATIHSFICNAPPRAYIKCIKSHTGYSSCEKCTVLGEYVSDGVIERSQLQ